jgi:hypothetical protein
MTSRTATLGARLSAVVVGLAAAIVMAVTWIQSGGSSPSRAIDASPSQSGWRTVEYEGVRVDIPAAWERVDTGGCEFQFIRWAHPKTPACVFDEGVAFYRSDTFDPAHRPGIRRTTERGILAWAGYTYAGVFAVYVSHGDRDVVRKILGSAH